MVEKTPEVFDKIAALKGAIKTRLSFALAVVPAERWEGLKGAGLPLGKSGIPRYINEATRELWPPAAPNVSVYVENDCWFAIEDEGQFGRPAVASDEALYAAEEAAACPFCGCIGVHICENAPGPGVEHRNAKHLFTPPSPIVAMTIFKDRLYLACERGIYVKTNEDTFIPLVFEAVDDAPGARQSDHDAGRNEDASSGFKPLVDRTPAPTPDPPFVPNKFGEHGD